MEEIIEYDNKIFYFKSLKENIIRQNENIKFLSIYEYIYSKYNFNTI